MALRTIRKHTEPHKFSALSTPAVPSSLWFASDFLLGAGMVIIQPETEKIVVIYDTRNKAWFLPKGRKDVGESLEEAALREAYEEVCRLNPCIPSNGFFYTYDPYIETTIIKKNSESVWISS